ncbi:MAG: type II toxin-antitoxin system HicB family antitoxin [Ignavibacteria bacterium]|nr:type II toxin-antitoxin system HicB family antitoxin [Ignavibacteria bacterium]
MEYLAIIKKYGNGYSAYLPDVPGCVAAAKTKQETLKLLEEALQLHLMEYKEKELPTKETEVAYIKVA